MKTHVWLAIEDQTGKEHHMKWDGHETKEAAEKEFEVIKNLIRSNGGKYPNTYIYEAEVPQYDNVEEVFDLSLLERYGSVLQ